MKKSNQIRKGLTLVELVVVVMILSILFTFVSVALVNLIRPSASTIVDKFKETLMYCYKTAMIHNEAVLLKINLDENKYAAFRVTRNEEGIQERKILESGFPSYSKIREIVDIRGVRYETGVVIVPFTYTGVAEDYTFHFGDESTTERSVLLYRYNGKVVVKPGEVTRIAKDDKSGTSTDLEENNE